MLPTPWPDQNHERFSAGTWDRLNTESSFEYYNTAKIAQIIFETMQQYPAHHLGHPTNTSTFVRQ